MMLLNNFPIVMVLACVTQYALVANCQKSHVKRAKKPGNSRESGRKEGPLQNLPVPATDNNKVGWKTSGEKNAFNGRFSTKDKKQCRWEVTGEGLSTLAVTCKKGGESFNCEYIASPAVCPLYVSKTKVYWKQISRALKKQKNLCRDTSALIIAATCKNAPKAAHFKLNNAQSTQPVTTTPSPSSSNKSCTDVTGQKKLNEYCSGPWSSVCTFFLSMVQDEDC